MIKLLLAAAALIPTTQTAAPPCLTRAEVIDATYAFLPIALDEVAEKCRPVLPPNAYLLNGGHALSERLKAQGGPHWTSAIRAFARMGGEKMPEGVSQATMIQLFREMARGEFVDKLKPTDCADANELAELLAPLPVENIGGLLGLLGKLVNGDAKGDKPSDFRICPETRS